MSKDIKVSENAVCKFYVNSWTKGAEQWAASYGFDDIKCLLAVQKKNTSDKSYVLIRNDEFIYDSKKYEDVGVHIDIIALSEGKSRI